MTMVLVDGDNVSAAHLPQILAVAGAVQLKRVYLNRAPQQGWAEAGFKAVFTGTGKNATNMVMVLDAAVAGERGLKRLVLVTSDRDFTPLLHHLRERGVELVLLCGGNASMALRAVADRVVVLGAKPELAQAVVQPSVQVASAPNPAQNTLAVEPAKPGVLSNLRKIIPPEGLTLSMVNPPMHRLGVRISEHPDKTWRTYFNNRTNLFRIEGEGPQTRVFLREPLKH